MASAAPTVAALGVIVFYSGRTGQEWWSTGTGISGDFLVDLRARGFWTIQVEWLDSWLVSPPGEDAGSAHTACRPATVTQWIHDNIYLPLGLDPGPGQCGFCITGNSGGSSQVAYSTSFFGQDRILDAVIPTSGPTHAAEAKGCMRTLGEEHYYYESGETMNIDRSSGFETGGPCASHDATHVSRWNAESVDTGANDLFYPRTRVVIILGADDCSDAPAHASDYEKQLVASGTPYLDMPVITAMGHKLQDSASGLDSLRNAILDIPIEDLGAPCYPLP